MQRERNHCFVSFDPYCPIRLDNFLLPPGERGTREPIDRFSTNPVPPSSGGLRKTFGKWSSCASSNHPHSGRTYPNEIGSELSLRWNDLVPWDDANWREPFPRGARAPRFKRGAARRSEKQRWTFAVARFVRRTILSRVLLVVGVRARGEWCSEGETSAMRTPPRVTRMDEFVK